ncbi:MAG: IclR family transcriptional regulator C-terminal domain-containing protein [Alphaproteobacteria bacterium]|nr:IclR family transcriptional regulator C-terminal domain-containing protein [Alphaproteobacteria bacterium]
MSNPGSNTDSSNFVGSFAKGLDVIRCFGPDSGRMSLSEVAEKTGFTRASARRFLLTLVELEYAVTDGKFFELTPKVLTLGHSYLSSLSYWESVRVYLNEVTLNTNESSSIGVLDGEEVVYVARSAAPHRLMSVALYVGARLPAYATSMGQVLLAGLETKKLNAYLANTKLEPFLSRTITDPKDLRRRLHTIREHGYVLVDQELEAGLRSMAVPIKNREGEYIAALNLSAHSARVTKSTMLRDYLPHLKCAAKKIEDTL